MDLFDFQGIFFFGRYLFESSTTAAMIMYKDPPLLRGTLCFNLQLSYHY